MDKLLVDAKGLRASITGVGVATKAPETSLQAVSTWLDALEPASKTVSQWLDAQPPDQGRQVVTISLCISLLRQAARVNLVLSSEDIDYIWSAIYQAILSSDTLIFPVTRSSQGFLVVPLCSLISDGRIEELWRFHLWLPDGQRGMPEVGIHAHQTLGHSWTLAGEGTDIRFKASAVTSQKSATHAKYEPVWTDAQSTSRAYKAHILSSTVCNTGQLLHVEEITKTSYKRDEAYVVPAGAYHRSIVAGEHIHATLFVFDATRGYQHDAFVLGPPDGEQFTEIRDSAGITAAQLVRIAEALRHHEVHNSADTTLMQAYARYFLDDELATVAHVFARYPSAQHRRFIKDMIAKGLDLDVVDSDGLTILDYCTARGDQELQDLIMDALRWKLTPQDIEDQLLKSKAHRVHQNLYHTIVKTQLSNGRPFSVMRSEYARALAAQDCALDGLMFAWYNDFIRFPRMPRLSDGIAQSLQQHGPGHIIYIAYRWLHKNPVTGKTANDDADHTQYRRMLHAIKQYLALKPEISTDTLGIWLDSICVNRKSPLPGIAALPVSLAQCESLITIEDDLFWTRAWCTVEAFIIQKLRKKFNRHSWYRLVDNVLTQAPTDMLPNTASTSMTWEQDRRVINFLQAQAESF